MCSKKIDESLNYVYYSIHLFFDCLEVYLRTQGCNIHYRSTILIYKLNNPDSYNILNKHFEPS
jgi:hypothetical protein